MIAVLGIAMMGVSTLNTNPHATRDAYDLYCSICADVTGITQLNGFTFITQDSTLTTDKARDIDERTRDLQGQILLANSMPFDSSAAAGSERKARRLSGIRKVNLLLCASAYDKFAKGDSNSGVQLLEAAIVFLQRMSTVNSIIALDASRAFNVLLLQLSEHAGRMSLPNLLKLVQVLKTVEGQSPYPIPILEHELKAYEEELIDAVSRNWRTYLDPTFLDSDSKTCEQLLEKLDTASYRDMDSYFNLARSALRAMINDQIALLRGPVKSWKSVERRIPLDLPNAIVYALVFPLDNLIVGAAKRVIAIRLTIVLLSCHVYKFEHGRFPVTSSELGQLADDPVAGGKIHLVAGSSPSVSSDGTPLTGPVYFPGGSAGADRSEAFARGLKREGAK